MKNLQTFCKGVDTELFFRQPEQKWSVAQNIKHLIISTNTTQLAFSLPKWLGRMYTGKPNRPSRSFEELVTKYKMKLEKGGKASGIYIPKIISPGTGKDKMLIAFSKSMYKLIDAIDKKWADHLLDQYLAPHPLLGKITFRELAYFTIYHTRHHLDIINQRVTEAKSMNNSIAQKRAMIQ